MIPTLNDADAQDNVFDDPNESVAIPITTTESGFDSRRVPPFNPRESIRRVC